MLHTHLPTTCGQYNRSLSARITKGLSIAPPWRMGCRKQEREQNFRGQDCLCFHGETCTTGFSKSLISDSKLHTVNPKRCDLMCNTKTAASLLQWAAEFTAKWKWRTGGTMTYQLSLYVKHSHQCLLLNTMPWKRIWNCRYTPCSPNPSTVWGYVVNQTFRLLDTTRERNVQSLSCATEPCTLRTRRDNDLQYLCNWMWLSCIYTVPHAHTVVSGLINNW